MLPVLKDATAVVGIGQTVFAKSLPGSETELAVTAILAALDDAGIDASEVDGLVEYSLETTDEVALARNLGAGDVTYFGSVGFGGGAGPAIVGHAAMAVAAGQCDVAVAWRSRKRGAAASRPWVQAGLGRPGAAPSGGSSRSGPSGPSGPSGEGAWGGAPAPCRGWPTGTGRGGSSGRSTRWP